MKLIDKSAVVAELEKQVKRLEDAFNNPSFASYEANLIAKGGYRKLKDILAFLDTLDAKEVDLDMEVALWANAIPEIQLDDVKRLAKYFYELGLKAKGE